MTQETLNITVTHLAGLGDGVAKHQGKNVFIPFTAAGDTITARIIDQTKDTITAKLEDIITESSDRTTPACAHFGECGGCNLQHIDETSYDAFKQNLLKNALKHLNIDNSILQPIVKISTHSRRRIDIKVKTHKKTVELGFFAAKSHDLVAITECKVTKQPLIDLLPKLKTCLETLKKPSFVNTISLTLLENGIDATLHTKAPLKSGDREKLTEFAKTHLIRLNTQHENTTQTLFDAKNATISFAGTTLDLPQNAFLQATEAAQNAITEQVITHLKHCEKVADLYSGCGTYSFPLMTYIKHLDAYEGSPDMIAAMHNAIRKSAHKDTMSAHIRDLYKTPLKSEELAPFDGVVINPPRNGALPQTKHLARSNVKTIVMVSCNPITFARDAKHLIENGYTLTEATPIDQFLWSSHLEVVGVFEK